MSENPKRNERCPHGVRWPHECKECQEPSSLAAMPCSVESVNRQVIENQLLAALDDKSKVAILATEEDLTLLIGALKCVSCHDPAARAAKEMCADMQQLKAAAFPPNAALCSPGVGAGEAHNKL